MNKSKKSTLIRMPSDENLLDCYNQTRKKNIIISLIAFILSIGFWVVSLFLPVFGYKYEFTDYNSDEVLFEKDCKYTIMDAIKKSVKRTKYKLSETDAFDLEYLRENPSSEIEKIENIYNFVEFVINEAEDSFDKTVESGAFKDYTAEECETAKTEHFTSVYAEIAALLEVFSDEIGNRNLEGLKSFYNSLSQYSLSNGTYNDLFVAEMQKLSESYLISEYDFNEAFYNNLFGDEKINMNRIPNTFIEEVKKDNGETKTEYSSPFFSFDEKKMEYKSKLTGIIRPTDLYNMYTLAISVLAIFDVIFMLLALLRRKAILNIIPFLSGLAVPFIYILSKFDMNALALAKIYKENCPYSAFELSMSPVGIGVTVAYVAVIIPIFILANANIQKYKRNSNF